MPPLATNSCWPKSGNQLFEVRLKDGNDDYVVLEILAENNPRELNIQRDKKKTLTIDGESYDFYYPSVEVAATENISTTNKAQIVITTRKHQREALRMVIPVLPLLLIR